MNPIETYLRSLIAGDDVPLVDELTSDDIGTARCTAAIARAALAWLHEKQLEAIRAQLLEDLEHNDQLAAWRLRRASGDLADATNWTAESRRPSRAELQARRYPWKGAA